MEVLLKVVEVAEDVVDGGHKSEMGGCVFQMEKCFL